MMEKDNWHEQAGEEESQCIGFGISLRLVTKYRIKLFG